MAQHEVQKAYSWEDLVAIVRENGGPEAEKFIRTNYLSLKEWLNKSSVKSEPKWDDAGVPGAFILVDSFVLPVIDNVDGKVGQ